MKLILSLLLMTWLKGGHLACSECDLQECKQDQDWHDQLKCYSEQINTSIRYMNCSWQPDLFSKENTTYTLHLKWLSVDPTQNNCIQFTTNKTFQKIDRSQLRVSKNATVWVSTGHLTNACSRTMNIYIIPGKIVKCDPPVISGHQSSNKLIFTWNPSKTLHELRYKEISSFSWNYVTITKPEVEVTVPQSSMSSSFSAQVKCIPDQSCYHCDWGTETVIIHKLTEMPNVTKPVIEPLSPGRRAVSVSWEVSQRRHVEKYCITAGRLAKTMRLQPIEVNVTEPQLQLHLSMGYYRITVRAYNKAGYSPTASVIVPGTPLRDLPGQLYATSKNGNVFLTWNPPTSFKCFVIEYGSNVSNIKVKPGRKSSHYTLKGPFEKGSQYFILLHTFENCNTKKNESTFGITYIYPFEGVPSKGPTNVTARNVTKHSTVVGWSEIPQKERLGFIHGYRIYYTEFGRNMTKDLGENISIKTGLGVGVGIVLSIIGCGGTCFFVVKRKLRSLLKDIPTPEDSTVIKNIQIRVPEAEEVYASSQMLLEESDGQNSLCVVEEDSDVSRMLNSPIQHPTEKETEIICPKVINCRRKTLDDSYISDATILSEGQAAEIIIRAPSAVLKYDYSTLDFFQMLTQTLPAHSSETCQVGFEMDLNPKLAEENQQGLPQIHDYVKQSQIQNIVFTNTPGCVENSFNASQS
ncbi:interleukin-12 receptor subunit beta-2-like isoform X2 [Lissotriton helveticus]